MSCPDCFSGHVHPGTPQGTVTSLHGLDVYVAEPSAGPDAVRGIVVVIPDAFGWGFVNNRVLADRYAEKGGYRVYLPEFMNGHSAPTWLIGTMRSVMKPNSTWLEWLTKPYHAAWAALAFIRFIYFNKFSASWPLVRAFFVALRQNEGARLPVAAAGFCWGGKHTVNLAHGAEVDGKRLIDAGFTGHPSLLEIPAEIEKIRVPTSFAMGELDSVVKMPQVMQIKEFVEGNGVGELKVYYGAGHGFCVRADTALDDADKQATEAEDQALDWFNRQFAGVSFE